MTNPENVVSEVPSMEYIVGDGAVQLAMSAVACAICQSEWHATEDCPKNN